MQVGFLILVMIAILLWSQVYFTPLDLKMSSSEKKPEENTLPENMWNSIYCADFVPSRDLPHYNVL